MPCIEIEACIRSVNQMLERANKLRDEYQTKVIEVDIDVAPKVKTLDHIISFPELRSLDLLCVEVLRRLLEQDAAAIVSRWHVNENTGFSSPQEVVNELEGKLVLLKHASSLSKTRKARAPDMVRGGYLTMASDDRDQGRKWVENEIAKAAAERGVALAGPIEWHKDFDRMLYWIEAVFDDSRKRWKFSYEQLEDCVNDKGVQRELKKAIGFFVSNASTQVLDRPEQQPLSQDRSAAARSHALRVFLCHSKSDKPAVRLLHSKLLSIGIHPWFDEEDLLPGQDWELAIKKQVRASDVVPVCLSQASVTTRGFAQKEIKLALDVADEQPEGTIFVIPVRLEQCEVPDRLRRWHWVNLFEEKGFAKLTASMEQRASELGIKLEGV